MDFTNLSLSYSVMTNTALLHSILAVFFSKQIYIICKYFLEMQLQVYCNS